MPTGSSSPRRRPRSSACSATGRFALEWVSLYRFQCRRLDRFIHGRVVFAGDAAHQVSPFGARGAIPASRMPRTSPGSSPLVLGARPGRGADRRAMSIERGRRRTRTSAIRPARPISSRRVRRRARLRDAALALAAKRIRQAAWSIPAACRSRASIDAALDAGRRRGPAARGEAVPDAALLAADGSEVYLADIVGPRFTLLYAMDHGGDAAASARGLYGMFGVRRRDPLDLVGIDLAARARITGRRRGAAIR